MAAVRKNAGRFLVEAIVNIALPYACFVIAQPKLGDVRALLLSSAPPIVWSVAEFLRKRRVDALAMIVLAGIALSLLAFVGGGSVQFLQLRENLVSGVIGLVFLGSAAIGKPLIYQLALATAARRSASAKAEIESLKDNVSFRRTMMTMTLVWGFGLLAATAVACALVFALPIATYLLIGPFVAYAFMGTLALWTLWYGARARRRGAARRS
jgi:hypothetical protein